METRSLPMADQAARAFSVARPLNGWYLACRSVELAKKPLAAVICNVPLSLFRDEHGKPTALLDRCAHRNVPLSGGRVVGSEIECPYHGWRYDAAGICRRVPALCGDPEGKARRVRRYRVVEQQRFVWVHMTPDEEPNTEPFSFPHMDDDDYVKIHYSADFEATLHATAENILDVPHTAFLHRGFFRGRKTHRIEARLRRFADRAEVEFIGEPVPKGILGTILAPRGGVIEHFDRFILPSVAQVEYRLGKSHLMISNVLTPVSDFSTRLFTVVALRLPLGAALLSRLFKPIALRVVRQDAEILKRQSDAVRRFGGEQFASTPVDLLGPQILRLLKQAERGGEPQADEPFETRIEMLA